MRNESDWIPSKFLTVDGCLTPSNDPAELGIGSRLIGALQARAYQHAIEKYVKGRLVDLGCGKAPLYGLYRSRVTAVICIDWTGSIHGNPHIDIEADLNASFPLADSSADTILCTDVLEHIREPSSFLHEIARVLAPSGIAIITVPFMYWLHEEPDDHFRYTRHRLRAFCEELGLRVLELTEYGGPLAVILDVTGKNMPKRWRAPYMKLATWFYSSNIGQRIDHRNRQGFPIGYLLAAQKP
jgi:SAM-dependent methyltransferase